MFAAIVQRGGGHDGELHFRWFEGRCRLRLGRCGGGLGNGCFQRIRKVPGVARTEWDAPEIDGSVHVPAGLTVGEFATVTIGDWRGYDLVATH